jgi:shikimate 5-dehydrogenase
VHAHLGRPGDVRLVRAVGDLGGGSLELVRVVAGTVTDRVSFPLGVLRLEAIRSHIDPVAAHVLIVGAGAAARAAALELSLAGVAEIIICDRTPERAASLVDALTAMAAAPASALPWEAAIAIPDRVGIVVTAVPADSQKPAAPLAALRPDLVVADLALVSQPAPVVTAARAAGACVIDGLEIHCERTAIDFHLLTGLEADTEMLRDALDEFFSA